MTANSKEYDCGLFSVLFTDLHPGAEVQDQAVRDYIFSEC